MAFEKPWVWIRAPEPYREYLALATHLPVARWRSMPRFVRYNVGILRQLVDASGLIGYGLRAEPHRRNFWTLTLWQDARSVGRFVGGQPHRDAMAWLLASGMTGFHTHRWAVRTDGAPPPWDEALAHLRAQ